MCEFCTKHGEGRIWYHNAKNYANDLMADLRRRQYIGSFFKSTIGDGVSGLGRLETIYRKKKKLPERLVRAMEEKAKEEHFGQIVPIEDIRSIVEKASTVVRLPCACRWAAEKKENRCCYLVSYSSQAWYKDLDMSYFGKLPDEGLEALTAQEAVLQMEALERQGMIHTIWTMITPFIGAICNCVQRECLGLRTLAMEVETLARAEYAAVVDFQMCSGCGMCADACQFDAVSGRVEGGSAFAWIDQIKCYGCGLCRNVCPQGAIELVER